MAGTITPLNPATYAGELDEFLYEVVETGLDALKPEKAVAYSKVGVRYKEQLDRLEFSDDPLEDYTTGNPTFASGSTLKKRDLVPEKMTISGTFQADEWLNQWARYAPNGNLTNLMMNQEFLRRVLQLATNKAQTQLDKLFWVGDKTAVGTPLRFFDGIVTKLIANSDGDVVFVTPAGAITQANVVARLEDVYKATPDKFLEDPNFKYLMSMSDFKLLNLFNNDVKKTSVGVLDEAIKSLFLAKRIVPFVHLPKDYIIGAHTTLTADSNFVFGQYFSLDSEFSGIEIDKIASHGKLIGWRVDFMCDAQYRHGGDILVYKPV